MLHLLPLLLAGFPQVSPDSQADPADSSLQETLVTYGAISLPELRVEDVPAWRAYLLPTLEESAFTSIPWQPTFADGIRRAEAMQKPMLLRVMNGHPLGCT